MVGDVQIVQRSGMRVVAQGGGRVPVAKPSLSLEDLALAHQLRGDAVTEAVKAGLGEAGGETEPVEAVREQVGPGVAQSSEVRREDPVCDDLADTNPLPP